MLASIITTMYSKGCCNDLHLKEHKQMTMFNNDECVLFRLERSKREQEGTLYQLRFLTTVKEVDNPNIKI